MERLKTKSSENIERISIKATRWVGSTNSLLIHTVLFIGSFSLYFWGVDIEEILLVVTTIVSLEAIYLSIFIQMSVNRQARRLHAVARDVEDIQENVEEIQEDVEGIEKDIDEIQEDVEEIEKDVDEIQEDVEEIQEEDENEEAEQKKDDELMVRIEDSIGKLIEEVIELKRQSTAKKAKAKSNKKNPK